MYCGVVLFFFRISLFDCSVEVLNEEAKRLNLMENMAIQDLIHKIKLVCSDDRVKYLSLFRGQVGALTWLFSHLVNVSLELMRVTIF